VPPCNGWTLTADKHSHEAMIRSESTAFHRIQWWTDGLQMLQATQDFIFRFYTMIGRMIYYKVNPTTSIG